MCDTGLTALEVYFGFPEVDKIPQQGRRTRLHLRASVFAVQTPNIMFCNKIRNIRFSKSCGTKLVGIRMIKLKYGLLILFTTDIGHHDSDVHLAI